jgi:hypothetical protein
MFNRTTADGCQGKEWLWSILASFNGQGFPQTPLQYF